MTRRRNEIFNKRRLFRKTKKGRKAKKRREEEHAKNQKSTAIIYSYLIAYLLSGIQEKLQGKKLLSGQHLFIYKNTKITDTFDNMTGNSLQKKEEKKRKEREIGARTKIKEKKEGMKREREKIERYKERWCMRQRENREIQREMVHERERKQRDTKRDGA